MRPYAVGSQLCGPPGPQDQHLRGQLSRGLLYLGVQDQMLVVEGIEPCAEGSQLGCPPGPRDQHLRGQLSRGPSLLGITGSDVRTRRG